MPRTRIMYLEDKSGGTLLRVGRVVFSKSGRTVFYRGQSFLRVGSGYKYNHVEPETGAQFWISGPRKDGADGLYGRLTTAADVDADVAEEYWRDIRGVAPGGPELPTFAHGIAQVVSLDGAPKSGTSSTVVDGRRGGDAGAPQPSATAAIQVA